MYIRYKTCTTDVHSTHGYIIIICIYMLPILILLTAVKVMHVKDNTISHGGWGAKWRNYSL